MEYGLNDLNHVSKLWKYLLSFGPNFMFKSLEQVKCLIHCPGYISPAQNIPCPPLFPTSNIVRPPTPSLPLNIFGKCDSDMGKERYLVIYIMFWYFAI